MYLIFVTATDENSFGETEYEFIFSKNPEEATGDNWYSCHPETPDIDYIDAVLTVKSVKMGLLTFDEDHQYNMVDIIDRVHAIAWEDYEDIGERDERIVLHYGNPLGKVMDDLYRIGVKYSLEMIIK